MRTSIVSESKARKRKRGRCGSAQRLSLSLPPQRSDGNSIETHTYIHIYTLTSCVSLLRWCSVNLLQLCICVFLCVYLFLRAIYC
uniref:Ovule protein n=1 Tax=Ascaris lumbricoides TaxID=6252 RepID=A0A0M3IBS4_ASCLU